MLALVVGSVATDVMAAPRMSSPPASAGLGIYEPGAWSMVSAQLENPDATAAEARVGLRFESVSNVQYAVRAWLPAESRRRVEWPVKPLVVPAGARGLELEGRLILDREGSEVSAGAAERGLLPLITRRHLTMQLIRPEDEAARELVSRLRAGQTDSAPVGLRSEAAPVLPEVWDLVDTLVIGQGARLDPMQSQAIRAWVQRGGRVWIQLGPETDTLAADLFGSAWTVSLIGERRPMAVTFSRPAAGSSDESAETQVVSAGSGVFSHWVVEAPGYQVLQKADGQPTVLRRSVGRGQVQVTTLSPAAWLTLLDADGKGDSPALQPLESFWPVVAGTARGSATERGATRVPGSHYVHDQIGYQVLDRQVVALILGGLLVLLLVLGALASLRGRMEWAAGAGVLLSLGVAGGIVAIGLSHQRRVPTTLASVDWVETSVGQPFLQARSISAIYRRTGLPPQPVVAGVGSVPQLTEAMRSGRLLRVTWEDRDRWTLQGLDLAEGAVQWLASSSSQPLPAAGAGAYFELSPPTRGDRLTGRVVGIDALDVPATALSDGLLAFPSGRLAPVVTPDGQWAFQGGAPLPPGDYIGGTMRSDRQVSRGEVYQQWLTQPQLLSEPRFLAWVDQGLAPMIGLPEVAIEEQRRSTILSLPVVWARPAVGQEVSVPAVAMPMGVARSSSNRALSGTLFDASSGTWITGLTSGQTVVMSFQIPADLWPLEVTGATLHARLQAPGREYEVVTYRRERMVPLASGRDAAGRIDVPLEASALPEVTDDGRILIGLRINESADSRLWGLEDLGVSIQGRLLQPLD